MSEVCGRPDCDVCRGADYDEREAVGHWSALYEREQARADRYEAEFSACKALLIAEQKRRERAEAERAEATAEDDKNLDGAQRTVDALRGQLSEARAALERVQGCVVRAAHALALALKGDGIDGADLTETTTGVSAGLVEVDAHITRALAALPVEPARRQVTENANALEAAARGYPEEVR
jgi:hypothetical protein